MSTMQAILWDNPRLHDGGKNKNMRLRDMRKKMTRFLELAVFCRDFTFKGPVATPSSLGQLSWCELLVISRSVQPNCRYDGYPNQIRITALYCSHLEQLFVHDSNLFCLKIIRSYWKLNQKQISFQLRNENLFFIFLAIACQVIAFCVSVLNEKASEKVMLTWHISLSLPRIE